jgi:hypothetical protein
MNQKRSPRFPFIPLDEAIEILRKLEVFQKDSSKHLTRPEMLKALDYGSFHGAAIKTIGALRAYDLLRKQDDGFMISPVGRRILTAEDAGVKLDYLQRAALSPLMFRRIWRRARHSGRTELVEWLTERAFTEQGAKRASRIYLRNSKLAFLEDLEMEPELPERGKVGKARREEDDKGAVGAGRENSPSQARRPRINPRSLSLPLSTGAAIIPKGITEAEFAILMQTLRTWKEQLVRNSSAEGRGSAAAK